MEAIKTIKRIVDVSSTLTGIGIRVGAQEYLGIDIDDATYAKKLRHSFGNMKGPFMKMVQFLATIPDALPKEFASEFIHLQSNAPSMGESFVRRRMMGELGPNWSNLFNDFQLKAINAASLQTLAISAPAKPGVCSASLCRSKVSDTLIGPK